MNCERTKHASNAMKVRIGLTITAQARRARGVPYGTESQSRRCLEPPGWGREFHLSGKQHTRRDRSSRAVTERMRQPRPAQPRGLAEPDQRAAQLRLPPM